VRHLSHDHDSDRALPCLRSFQGTTGRHLSCGLLVRVTSSAFRTDLLVHNVGGCAIETVNRSLNSGDSLLKMVLCNSLIRQAMICPLVAASAGTKCAIEHTTLILPVLRKCAAEV
jgi:hypothetical protein